MKRTSPGETAYSKEQEKIIHALLTNNVIVNAVAGSGKTTTAFGVVEKNRNKNILMLTYNKALQDETAKKAEAKGYKNLRVNTFHAFAGYLYQKSCKDNDEMEYLLEFESPKKAINYDIIIIDEAQDLTVDYLTLIRKIFSVNENKDFHVLVMGDFRQAIYQFINSDSRYLTQFDKFTGDLVKGKWVHLPLSTSYRVGQTGVDFINDAFYQENVMQANKQDDEFEYIAVSQWEYENIPGKWFNYVLKQIKEYDPNEVFVLSTSINSNFAVKFAQALSENGIIVENTNIDANSAENKKNKVTFSSFHRSKGREKELVIVLGPDHKNIDWAAQTPKEVFDPLQHNSTYVALTRAKHKTVALVNYDSEPLLFLDTDKIDLNKATRFLSNSQRNTFLKQIDNTKIFLYNPEKEYYVLSETTKFIKERYEKIVKSAYTTKTEMLSDKESTKFLAKLPDMVMNIDSNGKKYKENVQDFNNIALLTAFGTTKSGRNPFQQTLLFWIQFIEENQDQKRLIDPDKELQDKFLTPKLHKANFLAKFLLSKKNWINSITQDQLVKDPELILELAALYASIDQDRNFIYKQIKTFDWIDKSTFEWLVNFYSEYFKGSKLDFNKMLSGKFKQNNHPVTINSTVDIIDKTKKEVYDFTFEEGEPSEEKVIKLVGEAFIILNQESPEERDKWRFFIINQKSMQREEVVVDYLKSEEFFEALLLNAQGTDRELTLEKLLQETDVRFKKYNIGYDEAYIKDVESKLTGDDLVSPFVFIPGGYKFYKGSPKQAYNATEVELDENNDVIIAKDDKKAKLVWTKK